MRVIHWTDVAMQSLHDPANLAHPIGILADDKAHMAAVSSWGYQRASWQLA